MKKIFGIILFFVAIFLANFFARNFFFCVKKGGRADFASEKKCCAGLKKTGICDGENCCRSCATCE